MTLAVCRDLGMPVSPFHPLYMKLHIFDKHSLQFNRTPNQNSENRILEVGQPQIWIPGFSPCPFPQIPKGGG